MKKILKRIIICLICLFVVVCINFALPRVMPGDAVLMLTGVDEAAITDEQYEAYKEKLGLNKSLLEQFTTYLKGILRFDLGYSYHYNENVSSLIAKRIPATLQIAIPSIVISSLLALFLGTMAGYSSNEKLDAAITALCVATDSMPTFLVAMLLVSAFAYKLKLFPLSGLSSAYVRGGGLLAFFDRVHHLALPVLTMVITSLPSKFLLMKNTVRASRDSKYVLYAKARGLSDGKIKYTHILKNVSGPFVAAVGLNVGFILSGSMIIESIFSIRGMGSLFTDAVFSRDFPVLEGCLFVSALMVIISGVITDMVNILIDPKVRQAQNEK